MSQGTAKKTLAGESYCQLNVDQPIYKTNLITQRFFAKVIPSIYLEPPNMRNTRESCIPQFEINEDCANKSPLKSKAKELTRQRMERLDLSPLCIQGKPKRRQVKALHTLRDPKRLNQFNYNLHSIQINIQQLG